ncbi:hypothetical protein O3P69_004620 [Scylla paramamosain]|uniref:Uncharacterized protein n=1 Tax=Scylla paramamosain TaxID=85552 RepID=A0AAW0UEQ4_SCYPA
MGRHCFLAEKDGDDEKEGREEERWKGGRKACDDSLSWGTEGVSLPRRQRGGSMSTTKSQHTRAGLRGPDRRPTQSLFAPALPAAAFRGLRASRLTITVIREGEQDGEERWRQFEGELQGEEGREGGREGGRGGGEEEEEEVVEEEEEEEEEEEVRRCPVDGVLWPGSEVRLQHAPPLTLRLPHHNASGHL